MFVYIFIGVHVHMCECVYIYKHLKGGVGVEEPTREHLQ